MRTVRLVVLDELSEHRPEVPFVEDDHVVEALIPERPHDPLGDRVRAGSPHRAEQRIDARASGPWPEVAAIDGIPVAQWIEGLPAPSRGLDELPPDPGGGGVGCRVQVHQLAPAMGDEEEHGQRPEGQRLDRE